MFEIIHRSLVGALTGDALGVPFEFKRPEDIPDRIDMVMPPQFGKTYGSVPYATWSDDSSQLLCLWQTLQEAPNGQKAQGIVDMSRFARYLLQWLDHGYHQAGGQVFDCGMATSRALGAVRRGVPPDQSGDARSLGNGALMRVLAVALDGAQRSADEFSVARVAATQAVVTHRRQEACATAAAWSLLAFDYLTAPRQDASDIVRDANRAIRRVREVLPELNEACDILQLYGTRELPSGSGMALNSFWSAVHALSRATSYEMAMENAIRYGNDTDTTACIAGGIAGAIWDVPQDWIDLVMTRAPAESRRLMEFVPA